MLLNLPEDALGEALARVPLASHGALSTCCKQLRKIVKSDSFGALRRRLGWTEYGVFVLGAIQDMIDSECPDSDDTFFCLTHKLDVAQPPRLFYDACNVNISTASCEERGVLVAIGDVDGDGRADPPLRWYDIQVYDMRTRSWLPVGSPARTMPAHLPVEMHKPCLAFLNGQLVVAGEPDSSSDGSFYGWDEASRLWEKLPSMPFPVYDAAHAVIGQRLYVIGGHGEQDPGDDPCTRLQIYDAATRTWSLGQSCDDLNRKTIRENPPPHWDDAWPREWSACAWRGRIYVVGTEHGYQPYLKEDGCEPLASYSARDLEDFKHYSKYTELHCYDPASDQWYEVAPILFTHQRPQICVHNGRLVVFGHNREWLGVNPGQQWLRWHELKPKDDRDELVDQGTWHEQWYRTTSREYCERVNGGAPGYYAGVDGWNPWRCLHWEMFGQSNKYREGVDHPAAHQSVRFRGQGAVSLPLR